MEASNQRGPKAPKDPEQQRKKIYLMAEASIEAMERPDGTFHEIIYLENRVEAKLQMICPALSTELAQALPHCGRFREIVHSIGITVTADRAEDRNEPVKFVMQNYGKTNKYVTGSVHSVTGRCDGAEMKLAVHEWAPEPDDDILGTLYFYFEKAGMGAKATIVFYLNDGYDDVPEPELDPPPAFGTERYEAMLEKSQLSLGNTYRLHKAFAKARRGEEITLAFIGGSITQGAGAKPQLSRSYAYQTYTGLQELLGTEKIRLVKAGVGGTSSEFGIVRYDRDVRKDGQIEPDIVVVEYAVNDEGDETEGVCFESLVRKILNAPNAPAVVLLFAVFMNDWNLQPRLAPIGYHYQLPMVSVKDAVVNQFNDETARVLTKRQFFYDMFHPTNDGHTIMKDCLLRLFASVLAQDSALICAQADIVVPETGVIGTEFERLIRVDRANPLPDAVVTEGGFTAVDGNVQAAEFDCNEVAEKMFTDNWLHMPDAPAEDFILRLTCKSVIVVYKDEGGTGVGSADVYVDGSFVRNLNPLAVGWLHCNTAVVISGEDAAREHEIRIRMHEGEEDKYFTILGFGVVTQ